MKNTLALLVVATMLIGILPVFTLPAGAASMSEAVFFAKFNYAEFPELSAVKEAVDKQDYALAKEELLEYFKQRTREGRVKAFPVTEVHENKGMAMLPLDNILTGPYEFDVSLGKITVDGIGEASAKEYELDVTKKVAQELDNKAFSIMLFQIEKQNYPIIVYSRESSFKPVLVVETEEGGNFIIEPDKDTYIHSGSTTTSFGSSEKLFVNEQSNSLTSAYGTQTRRAYINFPLTAAANQTVTKATLKLTAYVDGGADSPKSMHVISVGNTVWNENTFTWAYTNGIGNIYSWQNDPSGPPWETPSGADSEYTNVTARFWYARPMVWEYKKYLADPEGYPEGREYGEKLLFLMNAFATKKSYGFNRTLETGERLNRWVDVLYEMVDTPAMTPDYLYNIVSFMWGDMNYLYGLNIEDNGVWWSNWKIVANAGLFKAVEFFPEFNDYQKFRNKVESNVEYCINFLYNPDMSFTEAAPAYNIWCVELFGDVVRMASLNNRPVKSSLVAKLKYAVRNALESIYPNGYDTNIGDSNYIDKMPVFKTLAQFLNDDILTAFVTGGKEGNPEYLTSYYETASTAYMRNSWDPDEAVYINFINNSSDGHYHPDSNQVVMYAYGQPLLVDSGRYGYSGSDIYTQLRNASAHNTIEAVGVSLGKHSEAGSKFSHFASNNAFDFAASTQYGYANTAHTRNVLFIKDGFAIVSDYVKGSNANQEYRQNWHFLPSNNASMEGNVAKTNFYKKANITIAVADAQDAQIRKGYHSANYGLVAESEYASYSKTGSEIKFDTVLYPTKAGEDVDFTVTDLAANNKNKSLIKIEGDINGIYYAKNTVFSDGVISEDEKTDAKMAYINLDDDSISVVDATYFEGADFEIRAKDRINSAYFKVSGDVLEIESDSLYETTDANYAAQIKADGVSKVVLNGEEVPFEVDDEGYIISVMTKIPLDGDFVVGNKAYKKVNDQNLIQNPSFEVDGSGWYDGAFIEMTDSSGWVRTTEWAHDGEYSLKTLGTGVGSSNPYSMVTTFRVQPGKSYYVSFYVYAPAKANAWFATSLTEGTKTGAGFTGLQHYDYLTRGGFNTWSNETNTLPGEAKSPAITKDFLPGENHIEYVITVPETAIEPNITIAFAWLSNIVYIDDVKLYEVYQSDEYVDNTYVNIEFTDEDGNELSETVRVKVSPGELFTYDAPEYIELENGDVYKLNHAKSNLGAKMREGENYLTAVYELTDEIFVTVKYVDRNNVELQDSVKFLAKAGSTVSGEKYIQKTIAVGGGTVYVYDEDLSKDTIEITVSKDSNVILLYYVPEDSYDGTIAYFSFENETTGFTGGLAKAIPVGTYTLSTDSVSGKSLYLDRGNYLEVKNLFDESLLTGFEEITVSFYSKVDTISTGDPNWPFFAAPDASQQQYPYEKYIAVLEQNNRIVVERYYNFGSRPGAISVGNTTDWKHVAVVFSKDGTTLYVNGIPTGNDVNYDLRTILGNESVLYIGKATWTASGEYFRGYIDDYKIFDHALTPQEIAQMATRRNVTIKYVTPSGEVLKTETKASFDSVKFELEPAEEIQHDGNVYGYLPSLSTPSIVVSENSNVITLVYGKIQASPVTVRFVDEFGLDIKESEEILLTFGREFNLSMVEGYSETLDGIDANTIYVFTGVEGGGIVGDGTEKEVLLRYKLMNLDTKVMTANRGATIQKSTGRNHHNAEGYKNRIMADSRTWSSSGLMYGLMGFVNEIPQGDIISAVISVYTGADNNRTTARSYELYAVEELGADWDRSTVELGSEWVGATSTFGVPEGLTPVAAVTLPSTLGDGVINEVQFDITGYLKEHANSNLNFIIVSTSADAYGVFHSEITSYKPKLEVKVVSGINMSFTFDGTTARAENVPAGEYTIIVAQYDEDGKLIDLASTSESILTITPKEGAKSAQAFLWHSKSTLVPLAQKIEVEY